MNAADIFILMLFAAIPVCRLIAITRRRNNERPGALSVTGIVLSIIVSLVCAGSLMVLSLFY